MTQNNLFDEQNLRLFSRKFESSLKITVVNKIPGCT